MAVHKEVFIQHSQPCAVPLLGVLLFESVPDILWLKAACADS